MIQCYKFLLCLCFLPVMVAAQNCQPVTFTYDEAGNRVQRKIVIEPCEEREIPENETASVPEKLTDDPFVPEDTQGGGSNPPSLTEETSSDVSSGKMSLDICVYPNPAQDRIIVRLNDAVQKPDDTQQTLIYIYDTGGKLIYAGETSLLSKEIDVSGYMPGTYFIKVILDDGLKAFKITKR